MKSVLILFFVISLTVPGNAQLFKKGDVVEVEPSFSSTLSSSWKQANFEYYDSAANKYLVTLVDGKKLEIPSKNPEQWIRPFINRQTVHKYGPGSKIPYERRENAIKGYKCNPSEAGVKRNIKAQMAVYFKDYPFISVDFTSFKGQKGYDDKTFNGQFVYPYKIEMLVHLKRTVTMGGKEFTEYQTWEFDREYEYVTRPKKQCEFRAVPSSDAELISRFWYYPL